LTRAYAEYRGSNTSGVSNDQTVQPPGIDVR
jgi:hypothetical protein